MNNQLLKPVCMVVGRDPAQFRHLQRNLGERAAFFASTEAHCLPELVKSGADVIVILWSSTSRQCAQLIHRHHPQARVILEGNRTSLPGRPEKNGFLSVMEKSQTRTELVRQVEAALEDCEASPEVPALRESHGLDAGSFIGRLSSLPTVSGDIQRTADHLLELLLSAIKTGTGGLFLQDVETGEYAPVSMRNLPYHANGLRIAPSSKLVPMLAGQSSPLQFVGGAPGTLLSSFVTQLGCNLVLPILIEGSLHGWFVFLASEQMGPSETNVLTSMGFFAAETLKQSYATIEAARRTEMDRVFLTKTTEALAWIKPDGELNIIHDANQLIALRTTHETDVFAQLASSVLKEAVHQARNGHPGSIRFTRKSTGKLLYGKTTCLTDGSVVLNLSTEGEACIDLAETKREQVLWTDLARSTLTASAPAIGLLADADAVNAVVQKINGLLAEETGWSETLVSVLESIGQIYPRSEVNDPANIARNGTIPATVAGSLLLLALSLRLRSGAKVPPLKISLQHQPQSALQIQVDFCHGGTRPEPVPGSSSAAALEYLALDGLRSTEGSVAFADSAFGSRWEVRCPVSLVQGSSPREEHAAPQILKSPVLQKALNVLQDDAVPVNQIGDEVLHG